MNAPTSLIGMVDDNQYGTIVTDVYEHIPDLLYPASVPIYAQMRRDPRLAAVVDGYGLQIRRAQWQLDGAGCRPEVTQFVADCLGLNVVGEDKATGARRRGVSWNDHLRSALLSQVWGHYAFELEAEIVDGRRARLTTLAERIPATIMAIHADPRTGALLGIDQQITSRQPSPQIPADRLVFYSRNREGSGWQGTSLLRPAYAPWLLKREMLRVNAISNRRWGAGVPVAEANPGTNPSPAQMAEAQRMVSAARAGDQAGASVPPGFTMRIVGLSGSIPDTLGFIRFLNQEMSGSVLMPHLDLGTTQTGARALGESFIDSWTLALESEAEAIADTATRQVCVPIVDWNWGEDEPVPRVVVSGVGSRREVTAESLQLLLNSGALSADPRLEAWVRREYRLPERDPDAPRPLPAGAPARVPDRPQVDEERAQEEEETPGGGDGERVAAAAPPAVDVQGMDAAYRQAVEDMTAAWSQASGPLVAALAAAVAAEVAGGALAGLAALAIPATATSALTRAVTDGMTTLARASASAAAVEVRPIARINPALSRTSLGRIAENAQVATHLIVAGYRSAATRVALAHAGVKATVEQVRQAVTTALTDLSEPKTGGLVAGNLSAAAGTAQGIGREQVLGELPDGVRFRASEELDRNTCRPCRLVDGAEYATFEDALADYPTGRYLYCAGRERCRGFIYAVIDEDTAEVAARRNGFNPNQRRDDHGMWTRGGGAGSASGVESAHAALLRGEAVTVDPENIDALMRLSAGGPIYNLSRLQVKGENPNLFRRSARDVSRAEMPQLSRQDGSLDAFVRTLAERGIGVRREEVDPRRLTATQNQLEGAKVSKLYATLKAEGWPEGSAIFVSRDGVVLDGHHRWAAAAAVAVTGPMEITVLRVDTDIDTLLDLAHEVSALRKGLEDVAVTASRVYTFEVTEIVTDTDDGVPEALFGDEVAARRKGFDPNQKRDEDGKWTRFLPGRRGGKSDGSGNGRNGGGDGDASSYGLMSDEEFEARQKMIADVIGKARKTLATEVTHTTADGAWQPERDRMHREIAAELYAKADKVPRGGKAVIAGGLGGAGKSTVLRDHAGIDQSQYLTLNPDDVKELMAERGLIPEVPDHPDLSPMERAALIHEESSRITKLLADMAYRDRRNIIWDITMSSESGVVSRLDDLDRNGYETRGVFVDIPVEVSVERALSRYRNGADRYRQGKGLGGRFVPPAIIRAQETRKGRTVNREVFDGLQERFDGWAIYDNSVTGRAPKLVAEDYRSTDFGADGVKKIDQAVSNAGVSGLKRKVTFRKRDWDGPFKQRVDVFTKGDRRVEVEHLPGGAILAELIFEKGKRRMVLGRLTSPSARQLAGLLRELAKPFNPSETMG
ncbi:phage portal protein family protein [Micromonospora costi]|uniref:UDP-N-acetylglucosamine kinase n=1 Tax=Micromonospora costi TaxID=1530042 RepID=A0A3B0A6P5_9ACTN|nr:DUF935 family protein [Micromonospora costi]RKN55934.1 DUF935 family protein [Micromonospora costi]